MLGNLRRTTAALVVAAGVWYVGANGLLHFSEAPRANATDHAAAPVVVELFTSQGCSSCPPAEALLGELAEEEGIIALELHVDYWDYIGWEDPFGSPQMTERQRDYARELELRYVYTPQMVIDGRRNVVGSRRGDVRAAILNSASEGKALTIEYVGDGGDRFVISEGPSPEGGATVWLVAYDDQHETEVVRGENRGRRLKNSNVVRELVKLADWNGERLEIPIDVDGLTARGRSGCAVLVQQGKTGPILGAAAMPFDAN